MKASPTTDRSPKPDWLYGTGTTTVERRLVQATSAVVVLILAAAHLGGNFDLDGQAPWAWWQIGLAFVFVVDVVGGAVANALGGAKQLYHGPIPQPATRVRRLVHDHRTFTALHVHPIVVGLAFPGGPWWWGLLWYAWALVGVLVVVRAPLYLQRPLAVAIVAAGAVASTVVSAPLGFAWFPILLLIKLVLSHAVHEEPYRPVEPGT